jgi:hypothetical protein
VVPRRDPHSHGESGEVHTAAAAVRWQGRAGCLGCLPANKPVLRLFLHVWLIARFSM